MTDLPDPAVTGSTGVLGGMVARQLADAGFPQRLLMRDAGRARVDRAGPDGTRGVREAAADLGRQPIPAAQKRH